MNPDPPWQKNKISSNLSKTVHNGRNKNKILVKTGRDLSRGLRLYLRDS